jgi:prepilin-type N-terminal cleavage/methylation domain-containing protein
MSSERPAGFTLLELVVVLVILALAATLAVPALNRAASGNHQNELSSLILGAREAAARRGETVYLSVSATGDWRLEGAASSKDEPLQSGTVDTFPGLPLTLIVSPVGTCGFDTRSGKAADLIRLNPLTCELR